LRPLLHLLIRSSGREALRRGAPFYFAVAIVAWVLFAGHGIDASTITAVARRSLPFRLGLLGAWITATMPATRALVHDPRTQFIKPLPVRDLEIVLGLAALLAIAEMPWVLLWSRGAGPWAGASATFAALALRLLWLARASGRVPWLLGVAMLAVWSWAPAQASAPAGAWVSAWALRRAWREGPRAGSGAVLRWVDAPAVVALASAYVLTVWRAHAEIAGRCLLLTMVWLAFATLFVHNADGGDLTGAPIMVEAVFAPLAIALTVTLAGPMLRAELQGGWLLDAMGMTLAGRQRALAMASAFLGMALAVVYAGAIAWNLRLSLLTAVRLVGETTAFAFALSVIAGDVVRFAVRSDGRDGARLIVAFTALTVVAVSSIVVARTLAIVLWVGAGCARLTIGPAGARWARRGPPPDASVDGVAPWS
jgi:hypothetical protein